MAGVICSVSGCRREGAKTGTLGISPNVDARPEFELVVHLCDEHAAATRNPAGWKIVLAYDRTYLDDGGDAEKMRRLAGFLESWGVTA